MLKELLELNEVTINISTTNNGQKNIVVMKTGETPLTLSGKASEHLLMEKEITEYASIVKDIVTSSNKDSISKTTKSKKEVPTTTPKKTDVKVTKKDTDVETKVTEDENQLHLIDDNNELLPTFDEILFEFKI